ncbi:MAG TPA: YrdB family protein [Candidatus Limnocylindria bacterium]|nr:YrdB family protein [Candidatus Limnocylindria bacterium]
MLNGANLVLRFVLELCGVAAATWWGYQLLPEGPMRYVLALVAAAMVIGLWTVVVAPKASKPIPPTPRFLIGSAVLLLTTAGLWSAGQPALAAVLAAAIVLNTLLMLVLGVRSVPEGWQSGRMHRS